MHDILTYVVTRHITQRHHRPFQPGYRARPVQIGLHHNNRHSPIVGTCWQTRPALPSQDWSPVDNCGNGSLYGPLQENGQHKTVFPSDGPAYPPDKPKLCPHRPQRPLLSRFETPPHISVPFCCFHRLPSPGHAGAKQGSGISSAVGIRGSGLIDDRIVFAEDADDFLLDLAFFGDLLPEILRCVFHLCPLFSGNCTQL